MPKVGDKEFPYTDEGMRQANMHSKRTGQRVVYQENNGKFGYQTGGSTGRNVYDTIPVESMPTGIEQERLPKGEVEARDNAFKRQFMKDNGRLPSDMKEPPSLLDESIGYKIAQQLGPVGSGASLGYKMAKQFPRFLQDVRSDRARERELYPDNESLHSDYELSNMHGGDARKGMEATYGEGTGFYEGMGRGMFDDARAGFPSARKFWGDKLGFQEGGKVSARDKMNEYMENYNFDDDLYDHDDEFYGNYFKYLPVNKDRYGYTNKGMQRYDDDIDFNHRIHDQLVRKAMDHKIKPREIRRDPIEYPPAQKIVPESLDGYQGGGQVPVDRPLNLRRKAYLGDALSSTIDERIASNIDPSTKDNVTDIRDIVTNINAYNEQIDPMPETRSVNSIKNLLRSERGEKANRLMSIMGMQEGGYVEDVRRPKRRGFGF